jgi:hypothetical protein
VLNVTFLEIEWILTVLAIPARDQSTGIHSQDAFYSDFFDITDEGSWGFARLRGDAISRANPTAPLFCLFFLLCGSRVWAGTSASSAVFSVCRMYL